MATNSSRYKETLKNKVSITDQKWINWIAKLTMKKTIKRSIYPPMTMKKIKETSSNLLIITGRFMSSRELAKLNIKHNPTSS